MHPFPSRNAQSSGELRRVVSDGQIGNSFDKLLEGEGMVRFTNGEHAECPCQRVEPTVARASRGTLVAREGTPVTEGKLERGISLESREAQSGCTVPGTQSRSPSPEEKENLCLDEEVVGLVDRPKGPAQVKEILSRVRDRPLEEIGRRWYRVRRRECLEKILVVARKNYKLYADIGATVGSISRVLSVLDTGAGPNLVQNQNSRQEWNPCVLWSDPTHRRCEQQATPNSRHN